MSISTPVQPHIQCRKGDIANIVLMPGDPGRVEVVGSLLDSYSEVANNREFKTITGTYKGTPISVTSTGIGCPSTAIATEELIACGAKILIRIGTCGGAWREDIKPGSVIIPTASIRDEGTTIEYVPSGYPAVADDLIVNALVKSANELRINSYKGINRTHDSFYSPDRSVVKWGDFYKDRRFEDIPSPILSSEMESSAIFVIASLFGVKAGAILAVDADPTPLKNMALRTDYLPNIAYKNKDLTKEAQDNMIRVALESLKYL